MKKIRIAALVGSFILSFQAISAPFPSNGSDPKPLQKQPLKRIIIDAGHGGGDGGCGRALDPGRAGSGGGEAAPG